MKIAIVGSGPGGLMAASRAAQKGHEVHLFEKRTSLGRKLLIAGSSGLNISHDLPLKEFAAHYEGFDPDFWLDMLSQFSPQDWIRFIEETLGLSTFIGTSHRYFVREMKASQLLKRWLAHLESLNVKIHRGFEWTGFSLEKGAGRDLDYSLQFKNESSQTGFSRLGFFLGGGSWETETPAWLSNFESHGITTSVFTPRNVGFHLQWSEAFLKEAEGLPLKKIVLSNQRGQKAGELVITQYGLEGTPIYFLGESGGAKLDLLPDFSEDQILQKLKNVRENFSPLRRVQKALSLSPGALALVFHHGSKSAKKDLPQMAKELKSFPLELLAPRSLAESISSSGGIDLGELTPQLELKKFPGVFCGGEMLNWHSPTGGFLIQACVSQGALIGESMSFRPVIN